MTGAPRGHSVAVIVPMFNAEATIERTLTSICNQTYRDLTILVVDDGSTDQGAALVARMACKDPRIVLLHQQNAGVAAARNYGARISSAPFLAFIDADDLWAPDKIEAQVRLAASGPPALVYCWFSQIDGQDRVYRSHYRPSTFEGQVLAQLARQNFIGNGSSMLMHREVFEQVGGFDESLHQRNAQGCEDYMFAMEAARHVPFRVVPRYLVGYRVTPGNMSSHAARMVRSYELVAERFLIDAPELREEFALHHRDFLLWHAHRAASDGSWGVVLAMMRRLHSEYSAASATLWLSLFGQFVRARVVPGWIKEMARKLRLVARPTFSEIAW